MKLIYSPEAIDDILNTRQYITKKLKNPSAAKRISRMIRNACKQLKDQPLLGMSVEAKIGYVCDYRYLICDKWLVFYRAEENHIEIIRVLDGRSDYLKVLFF